MRLPEGPGALRAGAVCAALLLALLLASFAHRPALLRRTHQLVQSLSSGGDQPAERCDYGALPGHWVGGEPEGGRWQLLGGRCALRNYLLDYDGARDRTLPPVSVLLLSDSTDRYLVQFLCEFLGGNKTTLHDPDDSLPRLNAYAFHTCSSSASLRVASAYYPGVHPTGPFHMSVRHNYTRRFSTAAKLWAQHLGEAPDMVVVASGLWDLARLYSQVRVGGRRPGQPAWQRAACTALPGDCNGGWGAPAPNIDDRGEQRRAAQPCQPSSAPGNGRRRVAARALGPGCPPPVAHLWGQAAAGGAASVPLRRRGGAAPQQGCVRLDLAAVAHPAAGSPRCVQA
jgi:hypothetical protein